MRSSLLILAIVAGSLGCCCGAVEPRSGHHHPSSNAVAQLARKLVLGSILQDMCPSDSGVISPLSVASSIMTFLASSAEGGETREQLLRLMGQPVDAADAAAADAFDSLLVDFGQVRDGVQLTPPRARPVRLPGCTSDEYDYEYDDDGDGSGGGDNVTVTDGASTTANGNTSTAPIVHVTDAVFVNRDVMPSALAATDSVVHIYPADFSIPERARTAINGWVSNNTRGLIGEIIPTGLLTKRTQLVVVNALYFRAHWRTPM